MHVKHLGCARQSFEGQRVQVVRVWVWATFCVFSQLFSYWVTPDNPQYPRVISGMFLLRGPWERGKSRGKLFMQQQCLREMASSGNCPDGCGEALLLQLGRWHGSKPPSHTGDAGREKERLGSIFSSFNLQILPLVLVWHSLDTPSQHGLALQLPTARPISVFTIIGSTAPALWSDHSGWLSRTHTATGVSFGKMGSRQVKSFNRNSSCVYTAVASTSLPPPGTKQGT